jgi:hypothetical protein
MSFSKSLSTLLICTFLLCISAIAQTATEHSIARQWNEVLLEAIRSDQARPTIHARNLFHSSIVMFDAFAVYDENADPYLLGCEWSDFSVPFYGVTEIEDEELAIEMVEEAINYSMYRLLSHRFANSPSSEYVLEIIEDLFLVHGGNPDYDSVDYISDGGAALGNFLAEKMIEFGLQDGSNEENGYANEYYEPANPDLLIEIEAGNPSLVNPNSWQPINLSEFIGQSGISSEATPAFLSPEWGNVKPFAIPDFEKTNYTRDDNPYPVWIDQGPPPLMNVNIITGFEEPYQWGFSMVLRWSEHLDSSDDIYIDVSPASIGNLDVDLFDLEYEDYDLIYDWANGGDVSPGHAYNPKTNLPYTQNVVKRGDYGRVLAEFWADGPDSAHLNGIFFHISRLGAPSTTPQSQHGVIRAGTTISDLFPRYVGWRTEDSVHPPWI